MHKSPLCSSREVSAQTTARIVFSENQVSLLRRLHSGGEGVNTRISSLVLSTRVKHEDRSDEQLQEEDQSENKH